MSSCPPNRAPRPRAAPLATLALAALAGCSPALRHGTGALAEAGGTAPLVRLAPTDRSGAVFAHGLAVGPSGDRTLLLAGWGSLDLGAAPAALFSTALAVVTRAGAVAAPIALGCDPKEPSELFPRPGGGVVVVCAELRGVTPDLRTTPLLRYALGPEERTPTRTRLVVPLARVEAVTVTADGSIVAAGFAEGERHGKGVVRFDAAGELAVRGWVPDVPLAGTELAALPDGDVVVASVTEGGPGRNGLHVARLAGADLAPRWGRSLRGVAALELADSTPKLAPAPADGLLYLGATLGRPGVSQFAPGLFALELDTGRVRWEQAFDGPGESSLDAVAARPGGGLVAVLGLDPGEGRRARFEVGDTSYTNRGAYDHDLVVAWLEADGRATRSERLAMNADRSTASVYAHLAFEPDGRLVVAGNFYRALRVAGRAIEGPAEVVCRDEARAPAPAGPAGEAEPACHARASSAVFVATYE
ncbi:MAG: hypothetical protein HY908_09795 [Myxococcales bacterium]|nr:hypothetical protein [Myxococcales bacterium]